HNFCNFSVVSPTASKPEPFAAAWGAKLLPVTDLLEFHEGSGVLIACTGPARTIIGEPLYASLLNGETDPKVVVDLAVPTDIAPEVLKRFPLTYIEVSGLQAIAERNLQERYAELTHADRIIEENIQAFLPLVKQRRIELAMREVPQKVKEIRNFAMNEVFGREVSSLDEEAREVLEKVIAYMEKKYIKVPMVMAKDILVNHTA